MAAAKVFRDLIREKAAIGGRSPPSGENRKASRRSDLVGCGRGGGTVDHMAIMPMLPQRAIANVTPETRRKPQKQCNVRKPGPPKESQNMTRLAR